MDFFRDQIWQLVIGLLGIIITIAIFIFQRNKKSLVYSVLTETSLLSIDDEIKGRIKIKYGNKNIQNIYLVVLKIENAGNIDIASADYEQQIIFSFEGSEILSVEVTDVSPKNLKPKIINETSKLIIDPILLNKKDYIVVKLLFSIYQEKVDVDARIIGVKEINRVNSSDYNKLLLRRTVWLVWLIIATIWVLIFFISPILQLIIAIQKQIIP